MIFFKDHNYNFEALIAFYNKVNILNSTHFLKLYYEV